MGTFLIGIIRNVYQPYISPLINMFGTGCRFYPSCSEYAIEVIRIRGFSRGLLKTLWRLVRCNPLCEGGIDLPENE